MRSIKSAVVTVIIALAFDAQAEITFQVPTMVAGKPTCIKGFFLIQADSCLNQSAISQHSIEEISTALMAQKDPTAAKKYQEALAYKKANGIAVYKTKITEEKSDILKLENGAIVEVKFGFVGFIGFNKKALLYPEGGGWKIWIEDKKSFPVEVLKAPTMPPRYVTTIGEILELLE